MSTAPWLATTKLRLSTHKRGFWPSSILCRTNAPCHHHQILQWGHQSPLLTSAAPASPGVAHDPQRIAAPAQSGQLDTGQPQGRVPLSPLAVPHRRHAGVPVAGAVVRRHAARPDRLPGGRAGHARHRTLGPADLRPRRVAALPRRLVQALRKDELPLAAAHRRRAGHQPGVHPAHVVGARQGHRFLRHALLGGDHLGIADSGRRGRGRLRAAAHVDTLRHTSICRSGN